MKKRILNFLFVAFLVVAVLLGLTACGDDEDSDKKKKVDNSTPEATIEAVYNAINDQDTSTLCDLIDFDALEKTLERDIDKKEFKNTFKEFFEENEDLEIEVSKIKYLEDDDDHLESLLETYDSYDEYVEEIEDEYDIDNLSVYTAKLKISDDYYEDILEDIAIVPERDVIYMTEDDGEYKIIYTRFFITLYIDYTNAYDDDYDDDDDDYDYDDDDDYDYYDDDDYDYDDDDYDYDDYDYDYEIDEDVVADLEEYEGSQTGKNIKELADYVVDNTTDDFTLYINYYGEDGIIDEYMLNTESEIKNFKKKLNDSHKYRVEIRPSSYGYCDVDITY